MYPPELVKPMIEELTNVGFQELKTVEAVKNAIEQEGTLRDRKSVVRERV